MITDILSKLQDIAPMGNDFEQFTMLMNFPDEQFNAIYPEMKKNIDTIFSSSQFYQDMINNLSTIPMDNIDEEKAVVENFIEEIKADPDISDNKKDFLITLIEKAVLVTFELAEAPRQRITVQIEKISPNAKIPEYAHKTDAGADIFAAEEVEIKPGETKLIKTGIKIAMPAGYAIFLYPRSGLSLKTGLRIANSVGVIDHSFHKEIMVIMENTGKETYKINVGDRIAQMVIQSVPMIKWKEAIVEDTERGGFGSTGK